MHAAQPLHASHCPHLQEHVWQLALVHLAARPVDKLDADLCAAARGELVAHKVLLVEVDGALALAVVLAQHALRLDAAERAGRGRKDAGERHAGAAGAERRQQRGAQGLGTTQLAAASSRRHASWCVMGSRGVNMAGHGFCTLWLRPRPKGQGRCWRAAAARGDGRSPPGSSTGRRDRASGRAEALATHRQSWRKTSCSSSISTGTWP